MRFPRPLAVTTALTLVLAAALSAAPAGAPPLWGPNVRANTDTSGYGQHEPGLAASMTSPNVVVIAAKDYRVDDIKKVWIYGSTDGGQTWPTQLMMPGIPANITNYSDPVVAARDDGHLYVTVLGVGGSDHGLWFSRSTDSGLTWTPSVAITYNDPFAGGIDDKEWLAVDNSPGSPFYHRLYVVWRAFSDQSPGLSFRYSTDEGNTWSARSRITSGEDEYAYPVVAADGHVYAFYMNNWGWCDPGTVRVTESTDGGSSWSPPVDVATANQPCSPPHSQDLWRFYSIITAAADPNDANTLWAAWSDDYNVPDGQIDVVYVRSTDGGATWTAPARLSHDPPGTGKDHITPVFFAQDLGAATRLHALWLDRRDDPVNLLFKAYYTSTADGGVTWDADQAVSDTAFNLNLGLPPGSGNAAGDYWGLGASGPFVYAAWTNTRNGEQDIYTSRGAMLSVRLYTPIVTRSAGPWAQGGKTP